MSESTKLSEAMRKLEFFKALRVIDSESATRKEFLIAWAERLIERLKTERSEDV